MAEDDAFEEGLGAWPAFADLLAATTLLFLVLFASIALPALQRNNELGRQRTMLDSIEVKLKQIQRDRHVRVERVGNYILLRIQGDATFLQDSSSLRSLQQEGKSILRDFGVFVRSDSVLLSRIDQVQVVGHTSSEGSKSHNWLLSAQRATNVALFLIDSAGLSPCRVTALGRGSFYPVTSSERDDVNPLDRRIELEVHPVIQADVAQSRRRASCRESTSP